MRRLIALFLLVLLPLQAVWGAAEPYCQHEHGQAAVHLGHHVHEHHADDGHDDEAGPHHQGAKSSPLIDHDHHCGSCLSVLTAMPMSLPEPLPPPALVAAPAVAYVSFDASRIERPNWAISR